MRAKDEQERALLIAQRKEEMVGTESVLGECEFGPV